MERVLKKIGNGTFHWGQWIAGKILMLQLYLFWLVPFFLLNPKIEASSVSQKDSHVIATFFSEVASIAPGKPFMVAIRLQMDPEWHTYWRNPGDSGLQTEIKWQLPEGFRTDPIQWPSPEYWTLEGIVTYVLHNEAWLLVQLHPPEHLTLQTIPLQAKVSWLMCRDICIPGEATLSLSLPQGNGEIDLQTNPLFEAARKQLPLSLEAVGWQIKATKNITQKKLELTIIPSSTFPAHPLYFFPDTPNQIKQDAKQIFQTNTEGFYHLTVPLANNIPNEWNQLSGVLLVENASGEKKGIDILIDLSNSNSSPKSTSSLSPDKQPNLLTSLFYAFLGGLILNVTPCVLPVISLKIFGFMQQAGNHPRHAFGHGLIFSLGVISSFLIMALGLMGLRAGGQQLGWGFQFQSPVVLVFLSALVFAMGLSLFGVFTINIGGWGMDQKLATQTGWHGSFFSGVLATLLATPCTAPYMGSAIGFALTQSPSIIVIVFSALGLGMASPYLIFSANPSLLKFLPKPGPWLETFKQFTGFLMVGTSIWLLWIFASTRRAMALWLVLCFLLVIALFCWIIGRFAHPLRNRPTRWCAWGIGLLLCGAGWFYLVRPALLFSTLAAVPVTTLYEDSNSLASATDKILWKKFSMEAVERALKTGKPVFIDFTAEWCLSCKVNEAIALEIPQTIRLFREKEIIAFKADWTNKDIEIAEALARYGRVGVPLYVYYPAGKPNDPILLPELITPSVLADYLNRN